MPPKYSLSFTEKKVAALPAPADGYRVYRDTDTDNLGVRVTSNGARSYIYEARVRVGNKSQSVRTTIGDVKAWTVDKARKEARRLASEVIDKHLDPRDEAAAKRAQHEAKRIETQRHTHIVEAVWSEYIDANKGGWGERHLHDHMSLAHPGGAKKKRGKGLTKPAPLASLMPLKLSELDSGRIASWLGREAKKRPTSAAGAYRLLRAFCNWTHNKPETGQTDYRGIVPLDACTASEVLKVLPESNAKEDDCLQRGQLAAWFQAVRGLRNPVIAAFLQSLLLTGPRREELARLQWSDVDFVWSSIKLRDKVEGTRKIPLTPYVASLLKTLPHPAGNPWVFSSPASEDGRLVEPTKAHIDALEAAAIPHITLHGLRRSLATLTDWMDELPNGVVAQIQGHKPSGTREKHYKKRPLDLLHKWHCKIEAWILEQAGVPFVALPVGERLGVVRADGTVQAVA
jgi:integrase